MESVPSCHPRAEPALDLIGGGGPGDFGTRLDSRLRGNDIAVCRVGSQPTRQERSAWLTAWVKNPPYEKAKMYRCSLR